MKEEITIKRLCIQWPRLGPYHLARLAATHREALNRGGNIVALETASADATYQWKAESAETPYQRVVIFPGKIYDEISAISMHNQVTASLDRLMPDAVAITSYSTPDARACLLWCKRHHRPAILMTATKEDDTNRVAWRERIKATLVNLYDAALAGGTPQQQYLEKLGFPRQAIFKGCDTVDNRFFANGPMRIEQNPNIIAGLPGLDSKEPFFLASNRFVPRKNLKRLIQAYHQYREQTPQPWRLLLLGDGPERKALEDQVKTNQIEGVVFCGFRQIEELPIYYALASAFVHPSLVEQWGLVVNEAMAAGLPVLVSERAGCAHDLVEHGQNGYLFNPTQTDELVNGLSVLSDPQTDSHAMGQVSKQIIANWSPDRFAKALWAAADIGRERASRSLLPGRALLWIIQRLSRRVNSFHSFED